MEWTEADSLGLIKLYKERPILWDPASPDFKLHKKKKEIWAELADQLKVNMDEVKRKTESLLTSYRRERNREGKHCPKNGNKVYRSKWFAFNAMQFLNTKFKERENSPVPIEPREESSTELGSSLDAPQTNAEEELQSYSIPKSLELVSKRRHSEDVTQSIPETTYKYLKPTTTEPAVGVKNEHDIFGEYIASQLKKFDLQTNAMLKHRINTLLFEAEMKILE